MKEIVEEFLAIIYDFKKQVMLVSKLEEGAVWRGKPKPGIGELNGYIYRYHGAGCEVKYEDKVCDFDVYYNLSKEGELISFSDYSIYCFTNSNPKYLGKYQDVKEVEKELIKLREEGYLTNLKMHGRTYGSFVKVSESLARVSF